MPRKATWALIIWSVLMILWAVSVTNAVGKICTTAEADRGACVLGANIGGAIGLAFIFIIWLVGFFVFTVVWFMSRPQRRLCPACGQTAKKANSPARAAASTSEPPQPVIHRSSRCHPPGDRRAGASSRQPGR